MQEEQEIEKKQFLFDEQLEQQILGSILIENKVLQSIELDISEDSFYYYNNKIIFRTIKNLLQSNKQADEQTLFYTLVDTDFQYQGEELKKFLASIVDSGIGMLVTPKDCVKILNHLSLKRELLSLNQEISSIVNTGSNIDTIDSKIGEIEKKIYNITNTRNKKESLTQLSRYTDVLKDKLKKAKNSNKEIQGVRTGLNDLDKYTGGLQKSDLIIIAARPSMGKTALATTIAKNVATILQKEASSKEELGGIAIFSLEMSGEQLAARIISMESGFQTKTIQTARIDEKNDTGEIIEKNRKITDTEWNKILDTIQEVSELPLYIDDTPALPISLLRSRARFLKSKYNICAIIIDYLQLLRASKTYSGNRVLEVGEITGTLKAIAKELEIPVVALSQLSRAVETTERKDKKPQLSDLRESGTIEQDADIVMFLYREEYYEKRKEPKITDASNEEQVTNYAKWLQHYEQIKDVAEVIIAKNRNGPVGTILLHFDREHMKFSSYAGNLLPQQITSYKQTPNHIDGDKINGYSNNSETQIEPQIDDELSDILNVF